MDVFDEEPGPWGTANILGCLDLGEDYTTRPWAVEGKGSALARLALDRPRARDKPPISRSRQGQIERMPCLPPPLRGVAAAGSGLDRREASLLAE